MYKKLPELLFQFSAACLMCCAVLIFLDTSTLPNSLYPLILIPYGVLSYTANLIFLKRMREMNSVLLLNSALFVPTIALIFFAAELRGFMALLFAVLFLLWLTGIAFVNVSRGLSVNTLMLCVEISMITLVIFTAFCTVNEFETYVYLLPVAACSSAIIAITMRRMDSKPSVRSSLLLLAVFALVFALLWFMVSFVAAPAGSGIVAVWHIIVAVFLYLGNLLVRFLTFLAELFAVPDAELPPPEAAVSLGITGEAPPPESSAAVLYVFVVAIVIAAGVILFKLRHLKISASVRRTNSSQIKSRISFKDAILKLICKLKRKIIFEMKLFRARKNPKGVLIRLMRVCSHSRLKKQSGETPGEFLKKLTENALQNTRLKTALEELSVLAERAVFSRHSEDVIISDSEYIIFAVRLLVIKNLFMDFISRIKKNNDGRKVTA